MRALSDATLLEVASSSWFAACCVRSLSPSREACRESLARLPELVLPKRFEVLSLRALGEEDEARNLAEAYLSGGFEAADPFTRAYLQAAAGQGDAARQTLETLPAGAKPYERAIVFATLGDQEGVVSWLTASYQGRQRLLRDAAASPEFERYSDDPEISALLLALNRR